MQINGRLSMKLFFPCSFEERDIIDGESNVTFYTELHLKITSAPMNHVRLSYYSFNSTRLILFARYISF
jgi:hypothetical protein